VHDATLFITNCLINEKISAYFQHQSELNQKVIWVVWIRKRGRNCNNSL